MAEYSKLRPTIDEQARIAGEKWGGARQSRDAHEPEAEADLSEGPWRRARADTGTPESRDAARRGLIHALQQKHDDLLWAALGRLIFAALDADDLRAETSVRFANACPAKVLATFADYLPKMSALGREHQPLARRLQSAIARQGSKQE